MPQARILSLFGPTLQSQPNYPKAILATNFALMTPMLRVSNLLRPPLSSSKSLHRPQHSNRCKTTSTNKGLAGEVIDGTRTFRSEKSVSSFLLLPTRTCHTTGDLTRRLDTVCIEMPRTECSGHESYSRQLTSCSRKNVQPSSLPLILASSSRRSLTVRSKNSLLK